MRTAIDIALLPSEAMMDKAVAINRELLKNNDDKIILNKTNCLPHILLCMGVVENKDLPVVTKLLTDIAKTFSSFTLTAETAKADTIPTGKKVSGLSIVHAESLQKLHETIMYQLWPYLSYDVDASMLYNPPEVEDVTFTWITGYAKKHDDPTLFHPHITVGFGEVEPDMIGLPIEFTASTLALCQLGNYCTCRKVFGSFELGDNV